MTKPKGPKRSTPRPSTGIGARPIVHVQAGVFKDRCLDLLDQVKAGTIELVVTKHGTPVARVVPVNAESRSAFGFMRGTVLYQDDIVSPDFDAWGDLE